MKKGTIIYIIDDQSKQVLMAMKTRKVGVGCWFGYGGKIDEGETPDKCICRETLEESLGVVVEEKDLRRVALIDFYRGDMPFGDPLWRTLFYITNEFSGEPKSSDEMLDPTWFSVNNLPWHEMKAGDELIIPKVLSGEYQKGFIRFSEDEKSVLEHDIQSCCLEDLVI